MDSKVVRLNKTCIRLIEEIRDSWLLGFKDQKLSPNKDLFTDSYIIMLALSNYANYLEIDKEVL